MALDTQPLQSTHLPTSPHSLTLGPLASFHHLSFQTCSHSQHPHFLTPSHVPPVTQLQSFTPLYPLHSLPCPLPLLSLFFPIYAVTTSLFAHTHKHFQSLSSPSLGLHALNSYTTLTFTPLIPLQALPYTPHILTHTPLDFPLTLPLNANIHSASVNFALSLFLFPSLPSLRLSPSPLSFTERTVYGPRADRNRKHPVYIDTGACLSAALRETDAPVYLGGGILAAFGDEAGERRPQNTVATRSNK